MTKDKESREAILVVGMFAVYVPFLVFAAWSDPLALLLYILPGAFVILALFAFDIKGWWEERQFIRHMRKRHRRGRYTLNERNEHHLS